MIRGQRKAHLRVWTGLAVALPLALAVILSLAASQVIERVPRRIAPPPDAAIPAPTTPAPPVNPPVNPAANPAPPATTGGGG